MATPDLVTAPERTVQLVRRGVVYERRRRRVVPLVTGVVLLGLGGAVAAQFLLVRPAMEADLARRTQAALTAAGHPDIGVSVSGRDVTLNVPAGTEDVGEITETVLEVPGVYTVVPVTGATGERVATSPAPATPAAVGATPTPGGTATPDVPLADLAEVGATLDAGRVVLLGTVPSRAARDQLLSSLRQTFTARDVRDQLVEDPQAGAEGLDAFAQVLRALGPDARAGAVSLRTGRLELAAVVPDDATRTAALDAATAAVGESAVEQAVTVSPSPRAEATADQVAAQIGALPTISFPPKSSELTAQTQSVIAIAVELLRTHPTVTVQIEGHTDANGKAAANLALSRARAEAVRGAMVDAGIASRRLTAAGYGASRPLDPGTGDLADAVNRRVVFVATVGR